ncbi:MAG: fumarate hydratase C-terminal domain-containing protein [Sedimentisphaerales bacterium]|nr:fumarate hydratase C-terminal domain-containing protein [Sedimentisphaerales bacterium]
MTKATRLKPPLTEDDIRSLNAGDRVLITGTIYTARDIAHKLLCRAIDSRQRLPFPLQGAVLYFVGPTPAPLGRPIGAAGPTTASRMDPFSPKLVANGLKAMIAKGYRNDKVRQALVKHTAVHLAAIGGAGALLSKHIVAADVIAYQDLGPEAVRKLEVVDFPVVVAYDSYGDTIYK